MAKITATDRDETIEIEIISHEERLRVRDLVQGIIDFSTGNTGQCVKVEISPEEEEFFDSIPWHINIGEGLYFGILQIRRNKEGEEPRGFHWEFQRNGKCFFETFSYGI